VKKGNRFLVRYWFLVLAAALPLSFLACKERANEAAQTVTVEQPRVQQIPAEKAYQLIQERKNDSNFIVLDVRTPQEYQRGHIAGAVNINYYDPDFQKRLAKLDTNKTYLVYCHSGHRSGLAVKVMEKLHFRHIYDLQGGMIQWQAKKLPLVRGNSAPKD